MNEGIGVVYDLSFQSDEVVRLLRQRLMLEERHVVPTSVFSPEWLEAHHVLMCVSGSWSEALLPGEWYRLFMRTGVESFVGHTVVPVATSIPLAIGVAPVLRRILKPVGVRVVSPVEVFFVPEGHFPGAGYSAEKGADRWLAVFRRSGQPAE